jgi:hypothetical protein
VTVESDIVCHDRDPADRLQATDELDGVEPMPSVVITFSRKDLNPPAATLVPILSNSES